MAAEEALRNKVDGHGQRDLGLAAWFVPSLADLVFGLLLVFILTVRISGLFNSDDDLARHLAVGKQILDSGTIPTVDLFSFTKAGEPFVPYEWLSEVIFTLAFRWLGLQGVAVLAAFVIALPFLLLTRWSVRAGANPFVVLATLVVGALASSMHWLARPHLFTILLALLFTRLLTRHRETGALRYLIPVPFLMAVWTNLHGGFLVGFVLIGIYLVGAVLDRLSGWRTQDSVVSNDGGSQWEGEGPALPTGLRGESSGYASWRPVFGLTTAGLLSLVAVGANPVGYRVLPHVLGYFRERLLVDVTVEYMSPNFHDLAPQFFLLLVLLSLAALALLPQRADVVDLGMLVVWISFSLYSVRNVPIFVVTCLPIVARLSSDALRQLLRKTERPGVSERFAATDRLFGRPLLPALLVAAALLLSGFGPPAARPMAAFDPKVFPVEALRKAEHVGVKGNLFNYFSWGGYVLYASYPKYRVFIDGQTDFYGEELTRDWLEVDRLKPDWEEVLDRYRIGWVLYPHESPLSVLLVRSPGWRLAYEDATADIFVRAAGGER